MNQRLTICQKLTAAAEIARGMVHLEACRFVHRDLAARNILVNSFQVCQIADFGLSRGLGASNQPNSALGEDDSYYRSAKGQFAVRWTAPEAMETQKYTMMTDMWSFGVVMVEIFTDGERPFNDLDNAAVMARVTAGNKHPRPVGCPEPVWNSVLAPCFNYEPEGRPSFFELQEKLEAAADESFGLPALQGSGSGGSGCLNESASALPPPADATQVRELGVAYAETVYSRVLVRDGETETATSETPLAGLASTPLVGLREAVAVAEKHITCAGGLSAQLEEAFAFATNNVRSGRSQGLTIEQVAAIHLYTQVSPFYKGLTGALGGWGVGGQEAIKYYLLYIRIAVDALALLPKFIGVVYRGIRGVPLATLLKGKGVGDELAWWAFTSTTGTPDVLRDPDFFGIGPEHGERVVFVIEVLSGVRVKSFSSLGSMLEHYRQPFGTTAQNEDEIMLKPGITFIIDSIEMFTNGVTQVKMHEILKPALLPSLPNNHVPRFGNFATIAQGRAWIATSQMASEVTYEAENLAGDAPMLTAVQEPSTSAHSTSSVQIEYETNAQVRASRATEPTYGMNDLPQQQIVHQTEAPYMLNGGVGNSAATSQQPVYALQDQPDTAATTLTVTPSVRPSFHDFTAGGIQSATQQTLKAETLATQLGSGTVEYETTTQVRAGRASQPVYSSADQPPQETLYMLKGNVGSNSSTQPVYALQDQLDGTNIPVSPTAKPSLQDFTVANEEATPRQGAPATAATVMFKFYAADTDGDGMLNFVEASTYGMTAATFKEIDVDGNGLLTVTEFQDWQAKAAAGQAARHATLQHGSGSAEYETQVLIRASHAAQSVYAVSDQQQQQQLSHHHQALQPNSHQHQHGAGNLEVIATNIPTSEVLHSASLTNLVFGGSSASIGGNGSSEDDSDQFEGIGRITSSSGLLGESVM
jgi:hypothetical protein